MHTENTCLTAASHVAAPHALITHTEGLLIKAQAVTPANTNEEVFRLFDENPALVGLPVVENDQPIGMINRNIFMQSFARPFHREIYLQKSCIAFMDKAPLIVEQRDTIQDLSFKVIAGGDKTLADGFIIAEAGRYAGVGRAADMLKAVADLQAEKNRLVMESIDYASVIQQSLSRASRESLRRRLADHFLIWEPRDVVSGDFYYFHEYDDGFLAILFDCTGHGVPGAFMTLIMSAFLQSALNEEGPRDPGRLMAAVNRRVKQAMGQIDHSHGEPDAEPVSDDGMDAAFCWVDTQQRRLRYAGAHMPLFLLRPDDKEILTIDGDRAGVGYATTPMDQQWRTHDIDLPQGTAVYLFSDGCTDQLGGSKGIAFGKRRIRTTLEHHMDKPMPEQRAALLAAFTAWQGEHVRKDDVAALGFRI